MKPQVEGRTVRHGYSGLGVTVLWIASVLVARLILADSEGTAVWIKVAAALIPVAPTALFLRVVVSAVRRLDELHRQVHLEALAIAYPLAVLLLITLGFLQLAVDLPQEDWSYRHVAAYLPLFYFVGLAVSWRRYR